MKTNNWYKLFALLVLVAIVVSACANQSTSSTPVVEVEVAETAEPVVTNEPAATEPPAAQDETGAQVMTVLEAIEAPVADLPETIEGNPPVDFGNFGIYARQVMEDVKNYRIAGTVMEYVCPEDGYLYISMDPGEFQGTKIPEGGVISYPCNFEDVIKFSTPHYSQGDNAHQQVTVAFVAAPFPTFQADPDWDQKDALMLYKNNEGKAKAYYFYTSGDSVELEVIE